MNWNFFNSTPVTPRDRVDTSVMPEAKPAAPKGDEDGAKFARALREEQPKERPETPAPTKSATREQSKEVKSDVPARDLRIEKPLASQGGKNVTPQDGEPVQLPKAIEDILKKSAPEASPETLSLVANLLLQGGPIKDNVPVLAVLTGDFSRLSAQDVPAVVLKSPFVAKALASDGVNDFLNTKTTIGDLLRSLNVEPSAMASLQRNGVDLEERVTPRKLLNAVGIDTQIIQAELQNLKGNLQLEGLRSYVERASKLGPEKAPPMMVRAPQGGMIDAPAETASAPNLPAQHAPVEAPTNAIAAPRETAMMAKADLGAATAIDEAQPRARLVEHSPFDALGEKMVDLPKTKLTVQDAATATPTSRTDEPSLKSETTVLPEREEIPVFPSAPSSSTKTETPQVQPAKGIVALGEALGAKASADASSTPTPMSLTPSEGEQEPRTAQDKPTTPLRAMTMDELIARLQKPEGRTPAETVNAIPLENAAAFASAEEASANLGDGGDDQPGDDLAQNADLTSARPHETAGLEHVQKANFATEITEVAKPAVPAESHDKIRQSVFEHATMMIEEGGGSIRVDLGGKDMGVLDLAVNVRNDQLDLRIIASSENVREILTQDIPRLKDSLSQQNLQLRNVEIAVSQSSAWAGQSGGGFRDSRQQPSTPREGKAGEISRPASFTSRVRSYVPGARSGIAAHAGRIQVLV